jgi:NAD(P)-dependent dehydrogenase (short-subunit alcohol dehydrogenase family)
MKSHSTAPIAGCDNGIVPEMAWLLAARGRRLVLAGRDGSGMRRAADQRRAAHHAEVHAHAMDLSVPGGGRTLFGHTGRDGLRLDAPAGNAGFGVLEEHVAIDAAQLQRMLQLVVVALAQLCLRHGGEIKRRRTARHPFGKAGRADPPDLAAAGVALMPGGALTRIVGPKNRVNVPGSRLAPRAIAAGLSNRRLRPLDLRSAKP